MSPLLYSKKIAYTIPEVVAYDRMWACGITEEYYGSTRHIVEEHLEWYVLLLAWLTPNSLMQGIEREDWLRN
jgi:hypothetical protein